MSSYRLGEYDERLENLAKITGRSKAFFVKKALEETIEDMESLYTALHRLENPGQRLSLSEMKKRLGQLDS